MIEVLSVFLLGNIIGIIGRSIIIDKVTISDNQFVPQENAINSDNKIDACLNTDNKYIDYDDFNG